MLQRLKVIFIVLFLFIFYAQTIVAQEVSPSATPTLIEYQLPYPGLLPDHPLYFLKVLRDSLTGFLISSPLKKAEFELLQSDKNLQAAVYLSEQNKSSDMIVKTLQESESNFTKSIEETKKAKTQGIYIIDFVAKITIANLKHQEIVSNLSKSAKQEDKQKFETEFKKIKDLDVIIKQLDSK